MSALTTFASLSCADIMYAMCGHKRTLSQCFSFLESFSARIDDSTEDGCWTWKAGKADSKNPYGIVWFAGKKYKCHRLAKTLTESPPNEDSMACHTCNNPSCCNPAHIYWGTAKTNVRDMDMAGRRNPNMGSKRYNAILSEKDVAIILEEAPLRTYGWGRKMAKRFGVCPSAISNIVMNYRWKQMNMDNNPKQAYAMGHLIAK
jgi:hypothetical protein